ncbi:hypothetical protein PG996_001191 [Apiospora saccharicola]|uniref:Uncharacterized protein n=1 Tax=Apiospora saccharicola TaxID=335842 RepID=A0ABR1WG02_9PEZI
MPRRRPGPETRPLGTREFEVMGYAFRCLDGKFPVVDCRSLASLAGFPSAQEVVTYWTALKRKVQSLKGKRGLGDLTWREIQVAGYAWQCIPTASIPEVKAKRLVKIGLYKTREEAAKAWGLIERKLHYMEENNDAEPAALPATGRAPRHKRNADQAGRSATKRRRGA